MFNDEKSDNVMYPGGVITSVSITVTGASPQARASCPARRSGLTA